MVYSTDGTSWTLLGELSAGVVAGSNRVTTSALVKGQKILATQWKDGIESCKATTGQIVGGGANPRVRLAFGIRENASLTGPIGADGGTGGAVFFLGATNRVGGYATAPAGGAVLSPSPCWQTVTFTRGSDPANPDDPTYCWSTDGNPTLDGSYGVLEGLALAFEDADSGPYEIYLDNIRNGSTVIQDFESAANGQTQVMFSLPSASITTSPYLLAQSPGTISPNVSMVVNTNADTGTNCLRVSWQFRDTNRVDWLRLVTGGSPTSNPMVDLRLPISLRLLLLPVGQKSNQLTLAAVPQPQTRNMRSNVTFSVSVVGASPFSYQWQFNSSELLGATASSLTLSNLTLDQGGDYSVVVSSTDCEVQSPTALLTVLFVNSQPQAATDTFARSRGMNLTMAIADLLANDTDEDLDTLSFTGASGTSTNGATISTNGTYVFYAPANTDPTNNVTDCFSYTISDGWLSATGIVIVTITPDSTNLTPNIVKWETLGDANVRLTFAGIPGRLYCVQRTTNMAWPIYWHTLSNSTNIAGSNGLWIYTDLAATNYSPRFYRSASP
jgi:hypothetical protein